MVHVYKNSNYRAPEPISFTAAMLEEMRRRESLYPIGVDERQLMVARVNKIQKSIDERDEREQKRRRN